VLRLTAALRLLIAYQSQPAYFFSPERLFIDEGFYCQWRFADVIRRRMGLYAVAGRLSA